ncbi:MAG: DUF2142 domain-containing protein [Acidimicrobiales bacterium]
MTQFLRTTRTDTAEVPLALDAPPPVLDAPPPVLDAPPPVRAAVERPAGRARQAQPRLLLNWFAAFGVIFVAVAAWTFASPLGSAPDEPAHLMRAASLVRGQLLGTPLADPTPAQESTVTVRVPQVFVNFANDESCFQFRPTVPAGCQPPVTGSAKDVTAQTYVGRYPPLYYFFVGLPTLVLASAKGIYAARLVSGALSAAMLALAVTSLRRCRGAPLLGAGLALAVTPMALYLAAAVNPSGLEISSGISAWVAAMVLCSLGPEEVSASGVGAAGISVIVLLLTRAASPLWALCIGAAFLALGTRGSWRALLRRRVVRGWLVACAVAGVGALAWDFAANPFLTEPGTPLPPGTNGQHLFVLALERLDLVLTSTIGFFGWMDTPSPALVIVAWLAALGAVLLVGVCLARRRRAAAVIGNLLAWAVLPVVLVMVEARQHGVLGQGRDFMALAVGIPVMAGVAAGERFGDRRSSLRLSAVIIGVLVVCQVVDFYGALRRNTVGTNGPLNAFATVANGWHPPVSGVALLVIFALAMGAFAVVLVRATVSQPAEDFTAPLY